jgi:predicted RNA binding protein YcfA (HicA-like mRNA interferase family)
MKVAHIIKLLEENGWSLSRQKGSHRQFKHPNNPNVITVPGHPSDDMPKGTESQILKKSGLKK